MWSSVPIRTSTLTFVPTRILRYILTISTLVVTLISLSPSCLTYVLRILIPCPFRQRPYIQTSYTNTMTFLKKFKKNTSYTILSMSSRTILIVAIENQTPDTFLPVFRRTVTSTNAFIFSALLKSVPYTFSLKTTNKIYLTTVIYVFLTLWLYHYNFNIWIRTYDFH